MFYKDSAETRSRFVKICAKYRVVEFLQTLILDGMERTADRVEI